MESDAREQVCRQQRAVDGLLRERHLLRRHVATAECECERLLSAPAPRGDTLDSERRSIDSALEEHACARAVLINHISAAESTHGGSLRPWIGFPGKCPQRRHHQRGLSGCRIAMHARQPMRARIHVLRACWGGSCAQCALVPPFDDDDVSPPACTPASPSLLLPVTIRTPRFSSG